MTDLAATNRGTDRLLLQPGERLGDRLRIAFVDIPVVNFSNWATVGMVSDALSQLEDMGSFMAAAQLVDAMGRDDRISGVLDTRIRGVLGAPLTFEQGGEDGEELSASASKVLTRLKKLFPVMFPDEELYQLLRWGLMLGLGVAELVWKTDANEWTPTLKIWHPQHVMWDWSTRSFRLVHQHGSTHINPGDGKWVLFAPFGLYRGWMHGMVRSLSVPWLCRQWGTRDWSRQSEVNGIPTRVLTVPADAQKEEKDLLFTGVKAMGSNSTIMLPSRPSAEAQFDFKLVEATARTWECIKDLKADANESIAITVLGQNLTTSVGGAGSGPKAAAGVHDDVRQEVKEDDDKKLSATLKAQCLDIWAKLNFAVEPDDVPLPSRQTAPAKDLTAEVSRLEGLGKAITALKAAGVTPDVAAICEEQGVPTIEPDEKIPDSVGAIFQYHIENGIVTKNEVRASLGLAPMEGGDVPATPPAAPSAGIVPSFGAGLSRLTALKATAEGQSYVDAVCELAAEHAATALSPDLARVQAAIDGSSSFEELKTRLLKEFKGMSPAAMTHILERALLMVELAGRHAIAEQ